VGTFSRFEHGVYEDICTAHVQTGRYRIVIRGPVSAILFLSSCCRLKGKSNVLNIFKIVSMFIWNDDMTQCG